MRSSPSLRLLTRRHQALLGLAGVLAVLPWLFPNSFWFDVAINAGLAAITCVGLNLLIGFAGQISLGHAGFFGLGAYCSAVLTAQYDWPPLLALASGQVLVGALAFAVAWPILRLKGHYLAMATLGLGIIIAIILNQEDWLTGGPDGLAMTGSYVPAFSLAGWTIDGDFGWYGLVAGLLLVTTTLAINLVESPVGRALRALHGSEAAAQGAGIDIARYKVMVFVLSAMIAAMAGGLFAHYTTNLTPSSASFFRSVELVTMVVFGGMGSLFGGIVGAVLLTVLPQFLTFFQEAEHMLFGLVLMLSMIFMPRGLVPTLLHGIALGNQRSRDRGQRDRGQRDRGQADRGQRDRGQQDRGQQDRGQQDRGGQADIPSDGLVSPSSLPVSSASPSAAPRPSGPDREGQP